MVLSILYLPLILCASLITDMHMTGFITDFWQVLPNQSVFLCLSLFVSICFNTIGIL